MPVLDFRLPDAYHATIARLIDKKHDIVNGSEEMREIYTCLRRYLNEVAEFLHVNRHLYEVHSGDFLLKTFWRGRNYLGRPDDDDFRRFDILPDDWTYAFDGTSVEELTRMVANGAYPSTWPQSLRDLIDRCSSLALPRPQAPCDIETRLDRRMHFGLTAKKLHEVEILNHYISNIHSSLKARHEQDPLIVDFGAGQGYLSSMMSHQMGFKVLALDFDTNQTEGATARCKRLDKLRSEKPKSAAAIKLSTRFIRDENDIDEETRSFLGEDGVLCPKILVGLHACGDLTPTLLKMCVENPGVKACVVAGCCYNLMGHGFPMSQYYADTSPAFAQSPYIKSLACQSTWRWGVTQSLKEVEVIFRKNCYRFTIQILLYETGQFKWEETADITVGQMRPKHYGCFPAYAHYCFERMGLSFFFEKYDEAELQARYDEMESRAMLRMASVWSVRALFASVIESAIVIDRLMYLLENASDLSRITLIPAFDPQVSPRNFVLECEKR